MMKLVFMYCMFWLFLHRFISMIIVFNNHKFVLTLQSILWITHCFCSVVVCCGSVLTGISIMDQEWFTGTRRPLSHHPLVPHICVSESGQHWFRYWLVTYSAPSHYLDQCWVVDNWTLRNKFQWDFNQIQNFSFIKTHLKISSGKWRPFCPGGDELNWTTLNDIGN